MIRYVFYRLISSQGFVLQGLYEHPQRKDVNANIKVSHLAVKRS